MHHKGPKFVAATQVVSICVAPLWQMSIRSMTGEHGQTGAASGYPGQVLQYQASEAPGTPAWVAWAPSIL